MRVLFWGTPEFATASLNALSGEGFEVVGVVTQPDRPHGRSRSVLVPPAVKRTALAEGLPVLQPERPRGDEFIASVSELEPDISVVVAYGHILRREIINLPPLGTINVHASLLPALRGAAPIQAAIRQGLPETGISIMQMVEELDAGPVFLQMGTPIADDTTFGELSLRLAELGALALVEALTLISLGKATPRPQDHARATYAPKLDREDARIHWHGSALEVSRAIRAYDPAPGAFTTLAGSEIKLFGASPAHGGSGSPGEVLAMAEQMTVACGEGALAISEVQPAGGRRLRVADWARGRAAAVGDVLGG